MSLNLKLQEVQKIIDKQLSLRPHISLSEIDLPLQFEMTTNKPIDHSNYIKIENLELTEKIVSNFGAKVNNKIFKDNDEPIYLSIWVIFPS